jgi:hypothetical protein
VDSYHGLKLCENCKAEKEEEEERKRREELDLPQRAIEGLGLMFRDQKR